ncbi:MAG: ABC transporter ATP-binding protein [Actinomycetaceae bacterium]|nr:ABC transporter ATP-binding protein [Actinomycetaceae bacterium]
MTTQPILQARDLVKTYGSGNSAVTALNHVSIDIYPGEFTSIIGPSGCGKSTLLHCLAGLDGVDHGEIRLEDQQITGRKDKELTQIRRDKIGFIFQSFNLVSTLSAQKNIELPMKLAKRRIDSDMLKMYAKMLGLEERLHHKPYELSGGQQQRVAIARALVSQPAIIVADEPTGNLDSAATHDVLQLLRRTVSDQHQTVLMVTHDRQAAALTDRVITMRDGQIVGDARRSDINHGTRPHSQPTGSPDNGARRGVPLHGMPKSPLQSQAKTSPGVQPGLKR